MKFNRYLLPLAVAAMPIASFAQGDPTLGPIEQVVRQFGDIVRLLIPIAIAILFLVFIWGLVKYVMNAGNDEAKKEGKRLMVGGIIAIFVVVAIYGIIWFLGGLLGVRGQIGDPIPTPEVLP